MKIRTDFITNSSSSSFIVEIKVELKNGKTIFYEETGFDDSDLGEIYVDVSPKQLGTASSISEMIDLLKANVHGFEAPWKENVIHIFDRENPGTADLIKSGAAKEEVKKAENFISELKKIKSMDDIQSISINGEENGAYGQEYSRYCTYDLENKEMSVDVVGEEFEKDGGSGGGLCFTDVSW